MPPGRPPLTKIIHASQKKKATTMISKKKTNVKTKTTKKKPSLKIKEEDFFFNSSGGMMMEEEEEEEEENNRIVAHGTADEEEKNYERDGMNLKEILTQRLEGRVGGPTRRSAKGGWTPAEDDVLRRAVAIYKGKNWKKIGAFIISSSLISLRFDIIISLSSSKRKDRKKRKILNLNFFLPLFGGGGLCIFYFLFVRLSSLSLLNSRYVY